MRAPSPISFGFAVCFSLCIPALSAQTNPPPPDAHEMVTRQPRSLTKPAERAAALDLLARARQNLNMHAFATPYELKVTFRTNGNALNEGEGTMEQVSDGPHWRWTAELPGSSVVRVGDNTHVYGNHPSEPVPMRVHLLRAALHWPIPRQLGGMAIRAADVEYNGKPVECLLLSGAVPDNPTPRAWVEQEYCIDPATALLQSWSEAPGIYVIYDYAGAAEFKGHTLPQQISVFEGGVLTVEARVESFGEAPGLDPALFEPTPGMVEAGGSFTLWGPSRFPLRVDPSDGPTSTYFQPVIVHATLDAQDGHVLDAEALQNSDRELSRSAIEMVRSASFPASGFQQEVFVNVQFHLPAAQVGGPPIFHSAVRWVIWEERGKHHPVGKLPRTGN